MYQRTGFGLFILIGLTVNAQTINLRGTVSTQSGTPIANAIVTLTGQGLKDTTGTDGAYAMKSSVSVVPWSMPRNRSISLNKGYLEFSLPAPSPVSMEIYNVKGGLLRKVSLRNAAAGFYRFTIGGDLWAAMFLIVKASIGRDEFTFRCLPLQNDKYAAAQSIERPATIGGKLVKIAAIADTLKTAASGYLTKAMAISSYDQVLNIALDSVGKSSIRLAGNKILDIAGNAIVARGPEDVVASIGQTKDIDQAADMGANAIRMLFTLDAANGMTPAAFDTLLARAVARHMLVWVSLYSWDSGHGNVIATALGGGNFYSLPAPAGTGNCSSSTPSSCYLAVWGRQWLKDLMGKYRSNVIIDAGQEFINPGDASSETARTAWANAARTNIRFFRDQGYTNPLQIMANFQGRDLYCIVEYGDTIRKADAVTVGGYSQTMFGWQAYWGTADKYYQSYQGALLLGKSDGVITAADAIHQFAATRAFPIEIGFDNYAGDANLDYQAEIDQAAADGMSWLWWSWKNGTVECPVSDGTCQSYVTASQNGFKGAKPLTN
jgi:hypothetical protein